MPRVRIYCDRPLTLELSGLKLSTEIPLGEADGIICFVTPHGDFLKFTGPRIWYAQEALGHSRYKRAPIWRACFKDTKRGEFLHHDAPFPEDRLPHITCYDDDFWVV